MKPCLDVLFDAYAYEKEQYGIVDTITIEEYEHLLKQFKVSRSMGLKLHGSPNCAACGKSLIQKMENGQKENVVLFGTRAAWRKIGVQFPIAGRISKHPTRRYGASPLWDRYNM